MKLLIMRIKSTSYALLNLCQTGQIVIVNVIVRRDAACRVSTWINYAGTSYTG